MDTEVLVVGSGPTGLMLANQLTRQGVKPVIIEKNPGPARETRALGVHARTLEIYSQMGLAERALALGRRMTGAHLWANGEDAAHVPLGDIGQGMSPFPYVLILGQDENERILGDDLRAHGVEVHWQHELVGFKEDAEGIMADVRAPDGASLSMRARWLAGCDGARSTVRSIAGIDFVGAPYEEVFFVADTEATGSMTADELNVYFWRHGFHIFFPMRGTNRWRVVGILPEELRGREGVTFEEVIPSIRDEAGDDLNFHQCAWFSTYRIHHRRARHFQQGRAFLLGDAAHVHSPVGAQGMNTGLQDAYNLAWKLALVAQGRAGDALLRTYALEREPFADWLLKSTDRAFEILVSDSPVVSRVRSSVAPRILQAALQSDWIRHAIFRTVSQIGIHYRSSPLSQEEPGLKEGGVRAGDRFPWLRLRRTPTGQVEDVFRWFDGKDFTLIDVPWEGNEQELKRAGIAAGTSFLVRPDGYVGLVASSPGARWVKDYLRERVGLTDRGS